jgi:hypothetical protein
MNMLESLILPTPAFQASFEPCVAIAFVRTSTRALIITWWGTKELMCGSI